MQPFSTPGSPGGPLPQQSRTIEEIQKLLSRRPDLHTQVRKILDAPNLSQPQKRASMKRLMQQLRDGSVTETISPTLDGLEDNDNRKATGSGNNLGAGHDNDIDSSGNVNVSISFGKTREGARSPGSREYNSNSSKQNESAAHSTIFPLSITSPVNADRDNDQAQVENVAGDDSSLHSAYDTDVKLES